LYNMLPKKREESAGLIFIPIAIGS
jgi:hypothetical protein